MSHHEACGPHEIFVGNTRRDGPHYKFLLTKGLKSLRLGSVAHDINGKPLSHEEGYAPLFVHRNEADLHNSIMMELTFGPNWRRG